MLRRANGLGLLVAALVALVIAAGCGSSSKSGVSPGSSGSPSKLGTSIGSKGTYTLGVLADESGLGASSFSTFLPGIKAGFALANKEGYNFKYVVVDTASSPTGTLTGAQRLVQQDHVDAVLEGAVFSFAASPYFKSHGIPVIGGATTSEWITDTNMFSVYGPIDPTKPATTFGKFMKTEGATNIAVISYAIPGAQSGMRALATSAEAAGLRASYLNATIPYGSTNMGPIALGMKSAHIDAFTTFTDPNTGFALLNDARQLGVNLKATLLPTGYGGDLLQAGPGALRSAQGVYFESAFEPVELHTAATNQFQTLLKSAGVTGDPTEGEYIGYTSVDLLVRGLEETGSHPDSTALIAGLSKVKNYSAAGLLGNNTLNMADRTPTSSGPHNCTYILKLSGPNFDLVSGAEPICGSAIQS
jgi:branched-chain amino acid transport system substrate-binding protein